jgi:hypothetical protein
MCTYSREKIFCYQCEIENIRAHRQPDPIIEIVKIIYSVTYYGIPPPHPYRLWTGWRFNDTIIKIED